MGFAGGRWAGNTFAYNTSVTNVNTTIVHNTYNVTVVNNVTVNKVSYNGGAGGVTAVPSAQERAAAQEPHVPPTQMQRQHVQQAVKSPALAARANGGHPTIAATTHPAAFQGPGVVGAHGAQLNPSAGGHPANNGGRPTNNAPQPQVKQQPQLGQQPKVGQQPQVSQQPQVRQPARAPKQPRPATQPKQPKHEHEDRKHEPQR
jgi:hypothetical protein